MVSIFTKIIAPCFKDYGAYIYKNHCTLFYGLWCVYLQKSMHPVLWIMVRIFSKISAPCFMDYGEYIYKNQCTLFYGLRGVYFSRDAAMCVSPRYNVSLRGVSFLTDGFIIATFSLAQRWWLAGEHPISHFTLFTSVFKGPVASDYNSLNVAWLGSCIPEMAVIM